MDGYLRFDETVTTDDIQHYGVLGMKWGVRNAETRAKYASMGKNMAASSEDYHKRLRKLGYSESEAQSMTEAREFCKKAAVGALAVGAAIGVAALGSYAVRRYGVKTLKAGQVLQTVHPGEIGERIGKESFYASYTKADNAIYKGYFGSRSGKTITKLAARQDIKIAPEAHAHKIFMETVKENPVIKWTEGETQHAMSFHTYLRNQGIDPKKASSLKTYRAFNHDLVHKSKPVYNAAHDAFYNNMKKQGYGALTDSYNAFGSGGYSYRPVIVFGDVKFDVASQTVPKAGSKAKSLLTATFLSGIKPNGTEAASWAASGATVAALLGLSEKNLSAQENFAKRYREEHPGTKKTNAQLKKMYEAQYS